MAHGAGSLDELADMTTRQLRLLYNAAIAREQRANAARIADINAGINGGNGAKQRIKALTESD